jgi:hypothetical protein
MCLRFLHLLVLGVFSWLRLVAREGAWKDAEILVLHHQLAVLQCRQACRPELMWVDRALIDVIPKARQAGLRLLVAPDTVVRWHRDLLRRRWAAKSWASRSDPTRHPKFGAVQHRNTATPSGQLLAHLPSALRVAAEETSP